MARSLARKTVDEVPISSITNGVHVSTWVAGEIDNVFDKYLGPNWLEDQDTQAIWQRLSEVPDSEMWEVHLLLKRKLMSFLRERARRRWVSGGSDPTQVLTSGTLLDRGADHRFCPSLCHV